MVKSITTFLFIVPSHEILKLSFSGYITLSKFFFFFLNVIIFVKGSRVNKELVLFVKFLKLVLAIISFKLVFFKIPSLSPSSIFINSPSTLSSPIHL